MPKVIWYLPGDAEPVESTLLPKTRFLVGRRPDPNAPAAASEQEVSLAVQTVTLPTPLASENHAVVYENEGNVVVRDLYSRNGTSITVPSGGTVTIEKNRGPVAVSIGKSERRTAGSESGLVDVDWSTGDEFRGALEHQIQTWLKRRSLPLNASVEFFASPPNLPIAPILLGDGYYIKLTERTGVTAAAEWGRERDVLLEYVHRQCARWQSELGHDAGFILCSKAFRSAHERVAEAAMRGQRLILLGETGTGKGMLARCYANHSSRRGKPFVPLNCALLERELSHSTLFGSKRGSFTGSIGDIEGVVERADRGVLFLDEIGDLALDLQAKLLTFLDHQVYTRLGDPTPQTADVMILCASSKDLKSMVQKGQFREELWYRLAVRTLHVPPLRERREDIAAYLSQKKLYNDPQAPTVMAALHPEAREVFLQKYTFPGNFRELEAVVARLPLVRSEGAISTDDVMEAISQGTLGAAPRFQPSNAMPPPSAAESADLPDLFQTAASIFYQLTDKKEPTHASELESFFETVMKPLFFARKLNLTQLDQVPKQPTPSYRQMAKRIDSTDDTVRNQVERYVDLQKRLADKRASKKT